MITRASRGLRHRLEYYSRLLVKLAIASQALRIVSIRICTCVWRRTSRRAGPACASTLTPVGGHRCTSSRRGRRCRGARLHAARQSGNCSGLARGGRCCASCRGQQALDRVVCWLGGQIRPVETRIALPREGGWDPGVRVIEIPDECTVSATSRWRLQG